MKRSVVAWVSVACVFVAACSSGGDGADDPARTSARIASTSVAAVADTDESAASVAGGTVGATATTSDAVGSPGPSTATSPASTGSSVDSAPSSSASVAPDTSEAPAIGSGALRFTRVDDPLLEPERRGGRFTTLDVWGSQGFVIGGHEFAADGSARPIVWRSFDGTTWGRQELPLLGAGATITTSVRVGDRLLVFGSESIVDRPLVWAVSDSGGIQPISPPSGDAPWSVVAAQPFGAGALLWGHSTDGASNAPSVFAAATEDGVSWRQAADVNSLLSGHGAKRVIDVGSGPAGTGAVLETDAGDYLVLLHDGGSWAAWVLDHRTVEIGGIDVTDRIQLVGAVLRGSAVRPAIFERQAAGDWVPQRVDVVPDDRNAGFQSSTGDRLHDSFLGGRVVTGNVATAEIVAVPAGGGTWIEAAYPDDVSGQGQFPIARVVQVGTTTLAIARDRPALLRLDGFAVTPVTSDVFPEGASVPSASDPVTAGDSVVFGGAYASVPAGTGAPRRSWAAWTLAADGTLSAIRSDGARQLELADLEVGRDGRLLGVGYESFVPANFANFIQPYEWVDELGTLRPQKAGGGGERTLRFHHVADTGAAVVAVGAVFDDRGRLDPVFFRRGGDGVWALAPGPEPDEVELAASVSLIDMCPLPLAGAVLIGRYVDDGDQYRTYVTGDGTSWEHFAPPELAGGRATIGGCAAAADAVLLFGTHDGSPQLWRTVDGRRFEPIAAPVAGGIIDAAVDESGGIWVLTTQRRVVQLGPDGRRRSTTALSPEELASPAGAGDVSGLAVTPAHVVILGSWNGGIGLWVADRPQ